MNKEYKCECGKDVKTYSGRCRSCYHKSTIGRKNSIETIKKMRDIKLSNKNPMWKGDKVGYYALHEWMRKRVIKPDFCVACKKNKPIDLANISGEYLREINDWEYLCRKCHMIKDGRIKNLRNH